MQEIAVSLSHCTIFLFFVWWERKRETLTLSVTVLLILQKTETDRITTHIQVKVGNRAQNNQCRSKCFTEMLKHIEKIQWHRINWTMLMVQRKSFTLSKNVMWLPLMTEESWKIEMDECMRSIMSLRFTMTSMNMNTCWFSVYILLSDRGAGMRAFTFQHWHKQESSCSVF